MDCRHVKLNLQLHPTASLNHNLLVLRISQPAISGNCWGKRWQTSTPTSSRMVPMVDTEVAISSELILLRIQLIAWFWYSRHSRSILPSATANAKVSMTALRRAGSSRPLWKTSRKLWYASASVMLKTGSAACLALSSTYNVSLFKAAVSS